MKNKKLTAQQWGLMIEQKVFIPQEKYNTEILKLVGVASCSDGCLLWLFNTGIGHLFNDNAEYYIPILRGLDQMTEEEKIEAAELFNFTIRSGDFDEFMYSFWDYAGDADGVDWLTLKGFDARGWIEQGLAIKQENTK
jgi:hypothetical protein